MKSQDRASDDRLGLLLSGADGDVLAARSVARELLAPSAQLFPEFGGPVLVLTAVLLHCAIKGGEGARTPHLIALLRRLGGGDPAKSGLLQSPLQFVRYAGAELQSLKPADRKALCRALGAALAADALTGVPPAAKGFSTHNTR